MFLVYAEDGKCVIDIENLPFGRFKDRARLVSIRAAALTLMGKCVFEQRAGGVTTGLGMSLFFLPLMPRPPVSRVLQAKRDLMVRIQANPVIWPSRSVRMILRT